MNDNRRILAIIPARGGSKGVPRKNVRILNGKPLVYYTIAEAQKATLLDRTVLSTEDEEIASIGREYGMEIVARPAELAEDHVASRPVYQHVITHLEETDGYHADVVVALQPTSPCRVADDIDGAIRLFLASDCDSVVGVCETEHPPYWTFTVDNGFLAPVIPGWEEIYQRQQAPMTYRFNGAVYVIHRDVIMEHEQGVMGSRIKPYLMPRDRSIDIDAELDLKLASIVLGERK